MKRVREKWFCRFARYCACSQSEKCFPIALLLTLVACSFRRTDQHGFAIPIYSFCHNQDTKRRKQDSW